MDNDRYIDFGYIFHKSSNIKTGYLLNFNVKSSVNGIFFDLFFVNDTEKYYITKRFFPSLLIKAENCEQIDEIVKKNYTGLIYKTKIIEKIDTKKPNHLCLPPDKYLEVFFYNEVDYKKVCNELKQIAKISKHKNKAQIEKTYENVYKICRESKNNEETYKITLQRDYNLSLEDLIRSVEEYDLPLDICFLSKQNLRCGKFYKSCYCNEKYEIEEIEIVTIPQLTIFAFDIETTKQPLKFPCPETDQIMMISFMINDNGFLINNKEFIAEDVQNFEYKIVKNSEEETICFNVYNCKNELSVLQKFSKIIQTYKPDIITTYNGDFFDIPFIEKRLILHSMANPLTNILHLDCFKWVKRDSYLPMGSQGLKAVTKAKLGYFPDEVDPELMMWYGKHEPKKLCVYSVSDAVATYNLYIKYVNPFIFSLCTLIPLSPFDVLSRGSGTLCESLLIAEALQKKILIPPKRIPDDVYFEGKYCDDTTYIGGHVECLKSGIYRSDFEYLFHIKQTRIQQIIELVPEIIAVYKNEENFEIVKQKITEDFAEFCNVAMNKPESEFEPTKDFTVNNSTMNVTTNPLIYHLDVAAMYPNIILTNRLQPMAVIGKETCIRCNYYTKDNKCQKNMKWQMRVEYFLPNKHEVESIKKILNTKSNYTNATLETKEKMFKEHLSNYSKDIYKKTKETKICEMENIVCQRENPFYVDVVQKFRDKRYELKNIQKKIENEMKNCEVESKQELKKKIVIYESLQVAHKCILNSFYGYVMRKNSRWYSMEMAAIVCNTGSNIIKLAKELIDDIGIPLELDTDGIWCLIPKTFPNTYTFASGKKIYFVCELLNLLVSKNFTNYQYHKLDEQICKENNDANNWNVQAKNEIEFEIDGPYKAMILPASTEEGKLIKKKYLVINNEGYISELKGFEYKRRGELKIIKKFQEDLFSQFLEGNTLRECYDVLKETCMYYLNIIKSEGKYLSNSDIFDLLSESKNMSKEFSEYEGRKTTSTLTANKLSELLGKQILQEKGLKCQYIVAKYPTGASITDRTVPVAIFQTEEITRVKYLKKWLKNDEIDVKKIIDWNYYNERLVNVMLKIIILPGILQGLGNMISEIEPPKWAKINTNKSLFDFDITKINKDHITNNNTNEQNPITESNKNSTSSVYFLQKNYKKYIKHSKENWKSLIKCLSTSYVIEIQNKCKTVICSKRIQKIENKMNYKINFTLKNFITLNDFVNKFVDDSIKNQVLKNMRMKNKNEYEFDCCIEFAKQNNLDTIFDNFYVENIRKNTFLDEIVDNTSYDMSLLDNVNIFCIIVLDFYEQKYFFCMTKFESFVVTDSKNVIENYKNELKIIYTSIYNLIKQNKSKNTVYFLAKNDLEVVKFLTKNDKTYVILENKQNIGLNNFKTTINEYKVAIKNYYDRCLCLVKTGIKYNVPFVNLSKMHVLDFLDFLYYKETKKQNLYEKTNQTQIYDILDNFYIQKGCYQNYCVSLEIKNSMINAILSEEVQDTFNNETNVILGKKLAILKKIVKKLKNSTTNNFYIENVIVNFDKWVKNRLNDCELKNCLIYLQKIYLNNVMNELKKFGAKVIQYNNEFIIIETMKVTKTSCDEYLKFVMENVRYVEIEILNLFKKIAIVDAFNIYYLINSLKTEEIIENNIFSNNERNVPSDFLLLFFSNNLTNNYFYDMIGKGYRQKEMITTMIDLYETQQNVDKLRSSCYKSLNVNAFVPKEIITHKLNIVCINCDFDGSLFVNKNDVSVCFKCLENHPSHFLDDLFCETIYNELTTDSFVCNECKTIKTHIVNKICKCGGSYIKNIDYDKINTLCMHIENEHKRTLICKIVTKPV